MASPEHSVSTLERPCLQDRKVILYTSSGCPKCAALKKQLKMNSTFLMGTKAVQGLDGFRRALEELR